MIDAVLEFATLVLVLTLISAIPVYLLRGAIRIRGWRLDLDSYAEHHLAALIGGLLVTAGLRTLFVGVPDILQAPHGPLQGANYTDLHLRLPMMRIVGFAALGGAALILWGAWRARLVRATSWFLAIYFITEIVLLGVAPAAFQRLVVQPNELVRE